MKYGTISIDDLFEMDCGDIIYGLIDGNYSLLETFGCKKLRKDVAKSAFACRHSVSVAESRAMTVDTDPSTEEYKARLKTELNKLLASRSPINLRGYVHHTRPENGVIFGYNHPTYGDILRIMQVCLNEYPDRRYLFPIDIIWFEELREVIGRLASADIFVCPLITPRTRQKMARIASPVLMAIVDKVAYDFYENFLSMCCSYIRSGGVVAVATSLNRRATIYNDQDEFSARKALSESVMTDIALILKKYELFDHSRFISLAVLPPNEASRMINLFKTYQVLVGKLYYPATVEKLLEERSGTTGERRLERDFRKSISDVLADECAYQLVCP